MKKYISILLLTAIVLTGCSKDDDGSDSFDGSMTSISDFVGQEILDTMTDLGLTIHPGNKPPNIEGKFLMSPSILESSNIPSDTPGNLFSDLLLTFSNQKGLNIKYTGEQTQTSSVGKGSFISGEGDLFSVFLNVISTKTNQPKEMEEIYVFTGRITSEGIKDIQVALFMVENNGNDGVIENGQGRVFIDGDNLARRVTGLQRMSSDNQLNLQSIMNK